MASIVGSLGALGPAAGSAVPAAAWAAYKYNRFNYIFDQGLRYQRYTAGYSMALEQAGMYREDIRDLTGYTIEKQDLYHIVGVIFYVITIQLIMAGRLGVHGPVPPGWLMGIHYTCGGLAMLYLTLSTWMAMHASARATSGMAYLLTRTVRLPIPSPAQLDKARTFGNQYESERLQDMFRVPFLTPPTHVQSPEAAEEDSSSKKGGKKDSGKKEYGTKDGKTRKLPKWYAEETQELYKGGGGPTPTQPEHFEIYRGLQQEWWCHDIYARIIEQIHGERQMLKQEGRVERWPSHMQPWMPPWTRRDVTSNIPARDEWCHTGGCDRRLSGQDAQIAHLAEKLSSVLTAVSETLDHELAGPRASRVAPPASAPLRQANVKWPMQLRPTILACGGDGSVAAIAPDAYTGAAMRLVQDADVEAQPSAFSFHGLAGLGDLLGASWGHDGLLLTTNTGSLAECGGQPPVSSGGMWHCSEVGTRLPTGGSILKWAATARVPQTNSFRAAVVFEGDETITLFDHFNEGVGSWEPSGEIRLPIATGSLLSFSMSFGGDELLISAKSGGVHRLPLGTGAIAMAAAPHNSIHTADLVWRGTCGLGGGRLAHLASRTTGNDVLFSPELFVSARA